MTTDAVTVSNEILAILLNALPIGTVTIEHVELPNQEDAESTPDDGTDPWLRANIIFNDGNQYSLGRIGNRRYEKRGIISIQTFVLRGKATETQLEICEQIQTLFETNTATCLWFNNGRIDTIGATDKWFQQDVVFEFKYHQIN